MKISQKHFAFFVLIIIWFPAIVFSQDSQKIVHSVALQLKKLEKENHFSGVVLIAKNGKPIYKKAFGFANLADSIPNKTDTKFNLASINKMFTGMAIMQLVQSGKISPEAKVGQYLPDYPNKTVADLVTIHQLLTHTSGMGSFWEEHDKLAKENFRTINDYLPLFVHQKLSFSPGSDFLYSNSGYLVLGLIIEKISGEDYFDFVKKNIYQPANMPNTDAFELDGTTPNMAMGYTMSPEKPGQWKNNIFANVIKGTPAGGGYSTVDDLLHFSIALQQNKLLNKENTNLYTSGKIKYRDGMYGYGFMDYTINGHRMMGHTGGHFGIADEIMIYPDLGYTVVILTNGEVENYWEASNFIKKQIAGTTPAFDNFFFTKQIIETTINKGYETGVKETEKNKTKYSLRENLIERYGYKALFEKKNEKAVDLFKLNLFAFPDSNAGYYNLGEAYRIAGQKSEAIANLKLYLEKEPSDKEAKIKYEELVKNTSN